MKPIYKPSGRAGEYGDLAINIYTGCNHGCFYCFAPRVLHKSAEAFANVEPRPGIAEAVKRQLDKEQITDKLIHLCFTCDPYPAPPIDTTPTREIIKTIKGTGNHVQILTKGGLRAERDFDLLDGDDWFGVTITGEFWDKRSELNAANWVERLESIQKAHLAGVNTWVSCEPVLDANNIYRLISGNHPIDKFKIGKLNYHPSDINWPEFGRTCERLCQQYGRNYYIKDDLRKEMEGNL